MFLVIATFIAINGTTTPKPVTVVDHLSNITIEFCKTAKQEKLPKDINECILKYANYIYGIKDVCVRSIVSYIQELVNNDFCESRDRFESEAKEGFCKIYRDDLDTWIRCMAYIISKKYCKKESSFHDCVHDTVEKDLRKCITARAVDHKACVENVVKWFVWWRNNKLWMILRYLVYGIAFAIAFSCCLSVAVYRISCIKPEVAQGRTDGSASSSSTIKDKGFKRKRKFKHPIPQAM